MPAELQTLLEQLKQAAHGIRPDEGKVDPEILNGILAFGADAVEPLTAMLTEIMAANWAEIDDESEIEDEADDEDTPWNYADVYILDLLSQLPLTPPVVTTLLDLLAEYEDDEWYSEEVVAELWHVGEVAIDPCLTLLRDRSIAQHPRNVAAGVLEELAKQHPELRDRIADGLVEVMSSVTRDDEDWDDWGNNAFMLIALGATCAERHIPFVRQMYQQDRVDVMIVDEDLILADIQGIEVKHKFDDSLDDIDIGTGLARAQAFFEALNNRKSPGERPRPVEPPPPPPPITFSPGGWGTVIAPKRPGRNDPCWCGSGKKYKKCHLREDEEKDRQH